MHSNAIAISSCIAFFRIDMDRVAPRCLKNLRGLDFAGGRGKEEGHDT